MGLLDEFVGGGGVTKIAGLGDILPESWYKRSPTAIISNLAEATGHRIVPTGNLRRMRTL